MENVSHPLPTFFLMYIDSLFMLIELPLVFLTLVPLGLLYFLAAPFLIRFPSSHEFLLWQVV
jgi:hypothetical protein